MHPGTAGAEGRRGAPPGRASLPSYVKHARPRRAVHQRRRRDELADGADVHRFVVIWRTCTRRSARGVGVDEGSQATITWQKRSQAPLQAF